MADEIARLKSAAASAGEAASKTASAKEQLGGVSAELEEMRRQNAELRSEKRSMEEAVTSLVRQTQHALSTQLH